MSCEKHRRQARVAWIMVPFGFIFSISFVLFIEYCPLGISLWGKAGDYVQNLVRF